MKKILLISLFFVFQFNPAYATEKGVSEFNSGVKYFKQKKYNSALKYFKQASSRGMKKSSLLLNLGVTQYKLQQYKQAANSFKKLSNDKKFRQIAYYNLGLVSEAKKKKKAAISWYKKSIKVNSKKNVSFLAQRQIDRLLNRKQTTLKKPSSSITAAIGYDDNINNAATNSPSNRGDTYQEFFAYSKAAINNNVNIKGSAYLLNYNTFSSENFMLLSAAVDYTYKLNKWKVIPELGFSNSTLNSQGFQQTLDLRVAAKRKLTNKASISLKYRYSNINAQNAAYNYLQGNRSQFRADYRTKINTGRLRMRYQFETNNRNNSASANYSPTRHTVRIRLRHSLDNGWDLTEELGYRTSLYGATAGIIRNDRRLRLRFTASKDFSKDLSGGVRYIYTSNDSNIASEDYRRNNIQAFANLDF